jgi:hypothetical protein
MDTMTLKQGSIMLTTREKFVEHYSPLFVKELLHKLPIEGPVTQMLLLSGRYINELGAHLTSTIHQSITKEEPHGNNQGYHSE